MSEGPFPDVAAPNFAVSRSGGEPGAGGFVNLGAELAEDLGAEEFAAGGSAGAPLIGDLLQEFQKGMRERLDGKDFETHYNLGNAYKDMDLYDEAIQEFRLAAQDPARALTCANLLGLCYLAKGEPDAAIRELRAGLEVPGHPREAYHGLRYDLGAAYDTQGDLGLALEAFETLQEENPLFRDVQGRVTDLRARLQQPRAVSIPAQPLQAGEPPTRPKVVRKKIAFI
jgi:tetratricopeptide (TPR) repeat protein